MLVDAQAGPGVLHQLTGVIARHQGDIASVDILDNRQSGSRLYLEIDLPGASKEEIELRVVGGELAIRVRDAERLVALPAQLAGRALSGSRFEDDVLRIRFAP